MTGLTVQADDQKVAAQGEPVIAQVGRELLSASRSRSKVLGIEPTEPGLIVSI